MLIGQRRWLASRLCLRLHLKRQKASNSFVGSRMACASLCVLWILKLWGSTLPKTLCVLRISSKSRNEQKVVFDDDSLSFSSVDGLWLPILRRTETARCAVSWWHSVGFQLQPCVVLSATLLRAGDCRCFFEESQKMETDREMLFKSCDFRCCSNLHLVGRGAKHNIKGFCSMHEKWEFYTLFIINNILWFTYLFPTLLIVLGNC